MAFCLIKMFLYLAFPVFTAHGRNDAPTFIYIINPHKKRTFLASACVTVSPRRLLKSFGRCETIEKIDFNLNLLYHNLFLLRLFFFFPPPNNHSIRAIGRTARKIRKSTTAFSALPLPCFGAGLFHCFMPLPTYTKAFCLCRADYTLLQPSYSPRLHNLDTH